MELADKDFVESCVPEEVLEEEAQNIVDTIVPEMIEMAEEKEALGLAAPQVGIPKKFFIARDLNTRQLHVYFNALYFKDSTARVQMQEGCLSYPGDGTAVVKRNKRIKMMYSVFENGKLVPKTKKIRGEQAIVFQHEIDHCGNGKSTLPKTIFSR